MGMYILKIYVDDGDRDKSVVLRNRIRLTEGSAGALQRRLNVILSNLSHAESVTYSYKLRAVSSIKEIDMEELDEWLGLRGYEAHKLPNRYDHITDAALVAQASIWTDFVKIPVDDAAVTDLLPYFGMGWLIVDYGKTRSARQYYYLPASDPDHAYALSSQFPN